MDSRNRLDLTEWVVHFVHERKPENDPACFMSDLAEEEYWCARGTGGQVHVPQQ